MDDPLFMVMSTILVERGSLGASPECEEVDEAVGVVRATLEGFRVGHRQCGPDFSSAGLVLEQLLDVEGGLVLVVHQGLEELG